MFRHIERPMKDLGVERLGPLGHPGGLPLFEVLSRIGA